MTNYVYSSRNSSGISLSPEFACGVVPTSAKKAITEETARLRLAGFQCADYGFHDGY